MNSTHSRTIVKQFYALLLSFSLALTPVAAADAERVFAQVSPSVVVIAEKHSNGDVEDWGSGVVVDKGIVVTNCHVIEDLAVIVVKQARDAQGARNYAIDADVMAWDEDNDICLLYAEGLTEPPMAQAAKLGAAKELNIGDKIYAIGAPAGLDLSLSQGIVTQLRGIDIKGKAPIVQTDATTWGGSSGGGLFNEKGGLVGIVTFGPEFTDSITFAMPVELVKSLIDSARHEAEKVKEQDMCTESPQYQCVLRLAQQFAEQIDDRDTRFDALADIATKQAQSGYFNDAKTTALQIPTSKNIDDHPSIEAYIDQYSTDYASWLLHRVSTAQAEEGKFKEAKTTAQQIDDAEDRAHAFGEVAIAQAKAGKFKDAAATAQQIDGAESRHWALSEIAIAQAEEGDAIEAKMIAGQIDDPFYRAKILSEVAIALTKAGNSDDAKVAFDNASLSARQIKEAYLQARAFEYIAFALAKAEDSDSAKIAFDNALRSAEQIGNYYPYYEALRDIAIAQAQAGYLGDAKTTLGKIEYSALRDEALIEVAIVLTEFDYFADAMQFAQSIDDDELKTQMLLEIAKNLTEQ